MFDISYNEEPDNLVEVNITLECYCQVPTVKEDGTIGFRKAYPTGDFILTLNKIKVPKEAVVSQRELNQYLSYKHQECSEDFVTLCDVNIWDRDDQHEDGGTFRFQ